MSDWAEQVLPRNHPMRHKSRPRQTERCPVCGSDTGETLIEQTFKKHVARFWKETAHLSSMTAISSNPSYKALIDMGQDAVPYLLRDMQVNRRPWFSALALITKENPVSAADAGKTDRMIDAWIRWGKSRGRLAD